MRIPVKTLKCIVHMCAIFCMNVVSLYFLLLQVLCKLSGSYHSMDEMATRMRLAMTKVHKITSQSVYHSHVVSSLIYRIALIG